MLIVMTYNFGLFMAIIMGNFIDYLLFSILIREYLMANQKQLMQVNTHYTPPSAYATATYQPEIDTGRRRTSQLFSDEYADMENVNPTDNFEQLGPFATDGFSSSGAINQW